MKNASFIGGQCPERSVVSTEGSLIAAPFCNRYSELYSLYRIKQEEFPRKGTSVSEEQERAKIGRRIKNLRVAQKLSVQELAKRSGMSAGYLSEVERGFPAISLDKLKQIAIGLACEISALMDEPMVDAANPEVIRIPAALSAAAEQLNLSHRA